MPPLEAMILAAGKGTRLQPATLTTPKPLIPFFDIPLIEFALRRLVRLGIRRCVVNVWYEGAQLVEAFEAIEERLGGALEVVLSQEKELMGTGGGIALARKYFDGNSVLVMNSDILVQADLEGFVKRHREWGGAVSLLVERGDENPTLKTTRVTPTGRIEAIGRGGQMGDDAGIFSGIYILEPEAYRVLPQRPCSVVNEVFLPLIASWAPPRGELASFPWRDLGTWGCYLDASMHIVSGPTLFRGVNQGAFLEVSEVAPGRFTVRRHGPSETSVGVYEGPDVVVEPGAHLDSGVVLGRGSVVRSGASLEGCVVFPGVEVTGSHRDAIIGPGWTQARP